MVVLSDTKLNTIHHLNSGESIKKVATDIGVREVTMWDWIRKRVDIENWQLISFFMSTAIVAQAEKLLNVSIKKIKILYIWFLEMWSKGNPVSGPILKEKAQTSTKYRRVRLGFWTVGRTDIELSN